MVLAMAVRAGAAPALVALALACAAVGAAARHDTGTRLDFHYSGRFVYREGGLKSSSGGATDAERTARIQQQCADSRHAASGCGFPDRRWLVVTKRRSGSRWFVDTMSLRSGGVVPHTSEMNCAHCDCGNTRAQAGGPEDRRCFCSLADDYARTADLYRNATCGDGGHHVGFKFMTPEENEWGTYEVLARSVCELQIPVAFMWRRNVLRRLISAQTNRMSRKDGMKLAHPTTAEEVALAASFVPTVKTSDLEKEIREELESQLRIEQAFAKLAGSCEVARKARVYYYEDLKDGADGAPERWGQLFDDLKIWVPSTLQVIHGNEPVLATVANPAEVQHALTGTDFEWMLHQD